jgi:hypothetical protein
MTTKPPLEKNLQAVPNHRKRKGKKIKSNIDSAMLNQKLHQQRQLNDRDH